MFLLRSWIVIALLSFSVGVCAQNPYPIDCKQHQCAAVVDAGSSGSRVHLYSYDYDAQGSPQNINEVYLKRIKPGLDTLQTDSPSIETYFDKLLSNFPANNIPIYVYATAGMRKLSSDDQQRRYQLIKQWFEKHPQWVLKDVRTLSGTEEGVYGFLGLNYHLHSLQNPEQPLSGLLEVGGASAQISFPVQTTDGLDPNDVVTVDLYGRHLQLYAHSFLGLGANAVFDQAQDYPACFPVGYPLMNNRLASGNAIKCQEDMGELLNNVYHVNALTLAALTLNSAQQWYVAASVSTLVSQAPMVFSNEKFSASELLQQADTALCHQDYPSLIQQYPDNESIYKNCMLASYFYGLWVHGYHFSPEQDIHFFTDYDSSWTLGVILNPPMY